MIGLVAVALAVLAADVARGDVGGSIRAASWCRRRARKKTTGSRA